MVKWVVHGFACLTPSQAVAEAHRCLLCFDAPCTKACPANVDVMRFIRALRFENPRRALAVIQRTNVLAGICGALCPKERLCEGACLHNALDSPVRIGALQTFAAAYGLARPFRFLKKLAPQRTAPRVAVVGAGPAGISAANVLAQAGALVTIYDAREVAGGMLAYAIPEDRMPFDFSQSELRTVLDLPGVELVVGSALGRDFTLEDLFRRGFSAVFLGIGLWKPAKLAGISDVPGVLHALPFLEQAARHQRFSGEAPRVGQHCVIIGGGSVAMDCAAVARHYGAEEIEVIALENTNEMPATHEDIQAAWLTGVRFHNRRRVIRLEKTNGKYIVQTISIRWKQPGVLLPENAEDIEGTEAQMVADTIIVAVGQVPDSSIFKALSGVDRDKKGLILVNPQTMETSVSNVYAGGDCVAKSNRTIVAAVADGRRAAMAIAKVLGLSPLASPYEPNLLPDGLQKVAPKEVIP